MKFQHETRDIIRLVIPVYLSQLLNAVAAFVDTVMSGRAGVADLAGVAIGSSFWLTLMIFPMGLFMAINPIVGQFAGAGLFPNIRNFMHQAARVGVVVSLIMFPVFLFNDLYMQGIIHDAKVLAVTSGYLEGFAWGAPAMVGVFVLRSYAEGMSFTRPYLVASVISLAVNIPANYLLIFGVAGWPGMGGAGAGWATAIAMWVAFAVMVLYTLKHRHFTMACIFCGLFPFDRSEIAHLMRVGFPIAMTLFVEVSVFSLIALFIGSRPAVEIAAHQVAMNVSYLAFTLPLSLSFVATIRVSNFVGAGDYQAARRSSQVVVVLGLLAAVFNIIILVGFGKQIAGFYSDSVPVIELATTLMLFSAMYQLADVFVVPTQGALRGYKDTRVPMFLAIIAYWVITLPIGYLLGLTDFAGGAMGATGFWISLVTGLFISGVLMTVRLWFTVRRYLNYA